MNKVTVEVSQRAAIARGSATWGAVPVDFAAVLAELSVDERGSLSVNEQNGGALLCGSLIVTADGPDTSSVVAAIRARLADAAERRRREDERLAEWAVEAEGWLGEVDAIVERVRKVGEYYRAPFVNEERRARYPDICSRVDQAIERIRAAGAARESDKAEALRAEKAREAASRQAWIEWARERGSEDLRAAIRDGYPLGDRLAKEVRDILCPEIDGAERILSWSDSEERTVPRADARELHQRVTTAMAGMRAPAGTEIRVSRIQRITSYVPHATICDSAVHDCEHSVDRDGDVKVNRTGVIVEVVAAHETLSVAYLVK